MSFQSPQFILAAIITFVVAVAVHEFMHAWVALKLGDDTAERLGRVTLNPAAHFDPLGFIFGILMVLGIAPIAWGRPVPVNTYRLRGGRKGMALVAVAGPLSNLAMAFTVPIVFFLLGNMATDAGGDKSVVQFFSTFAVTMLLFNVALFVFNLVPVPPLDGFNILVGVVPSYWLPMLESIRQYAWIMLIALIMIRLPGGESLLGIIVNPAQSVVLDLVMEVNTTVLHLFGVSSR